MIEVNKVKGDTQECFSAKESGGTKVSWSPPIKSNRFKSCKERKIRKVGLERLEFLVLGFPIKFMYLCVFLELIKSILCFVYFISYSHLFS